MNTEKTIVTINGIKMEVDLRHATIVHENLRVGSKIKLLEKGGYSGPTVYAGVIVGFDAFQSLPTITVAYLAGSSYSVELRFAAINEKSADKWEMVPSQDDDMPVQKATIEEAFQRQLDKLARETAELTEKRDYFRRMFGAYWSAAVELADHE